MLRLNFAVILLGTASFGAAQAFAAEWLPDYLSGRETCQKNSGSLAKEFGAFVDVPVDYAHPASGVTSIYYWLSEPMNAAKPTLVYFVGGPGGSSHQEEFQLSPSGFNVVYFDQRGVSCSKAPNRTLHRDPVFYSSENTARDLERVRQALGVDQISVYGHSYGTVPATIYASLFPVHTRALILEGVIFEGGKNLYQSAYVHELVQRHFDGLSRETQETILRYSRDPRLSRSWYSRLNQFMMYLDDPFRHLDQYLGEVLKEGEVDPTVALSSFAEFPESPESGDEFGFGRVMFAMIACKELDMASPEATYYSIFDAHGRLVSDGDASAQNSLCQELGIKPGTPYSAERYPVKVPVTYFQGEYDGATEMPGAIHHFESVPQGQAQLLLLEKGGHLPNQNFLRDREEGSDAELALFSQAARGERVSVEALDRFNALNPLKWRLRSR